MKYKKAKVSFNTTDQDGWSRDITRGYSYNAYFIPETDSTTLFLSDIDKVIKKIPQPYNEINIKRFLYPDLLDEKEKNYICNIKEINITKKLFNILNTLTTTKEKTSKVLQEYLTLRDLFKETENKLIKELLQ